uniref:Ig-like domain-containing protein n=1 Tax=Poecilia formosa TaxID=48698 RepID=A0A096M5D0_POEFO
SASFPASLTVDPSSSQIFEGEPLRLSCDDDISSSAGWILRRNTSNQHMTECGVKWGRRTGATCRISLTVSWDSGLYWCQSTEGVISSSVNLTVTGKTSFSAPSRLQRVAHSSVKVTSGFKCSDYKQQNFEDWDRTALCGNFTSNIAGICAAKSTTNYFKCTVKWKVSSFSESSALLHQHINSPSSSSVSASAPPPVEEGLHFVFHVLLHLLVFCPYFICTALLVSVCRSRTTGNHQTSAEPGLDDEYDDVATPVTTEHHF